MGAVGNRMLGKVMHILCLSSHSPSDTETQGQKSSPGTVPDCRLRCKSALVPGGCCLEGTGGAEGLCGYHLSQQHFMSLL